MVLEVVFLGNALEYGYSLPAIFLGKNNLLNNIFSKPRTGKLC